MTGSWGTSLPPYGTPASVAAQIEHCLRHRHSAMLSRLSSRKYCMQLREPQTAICNPGMTRETSSVMLHIMSPNNTRAARACRRQTQRITNEALLQVQIMADQYVEYMSSHAMGKMNQVPTSKATVALRLHTWRNKPSLNFMMLALCTAVTRFLLFK